MSDDEHIERVYTGERNAVEFRYIGAPSPDGLVDALNACRNALSAQERFRCLSAEAIPTVGRTIVVRANLRDAFAPFIDMTVSSVHLPDDVGVLVA